MEILERKGSDLYTLAEKTLGRRSLIHTCKKRGYTNTFTNNNYYTYHTPIANSYTHLGMLVLGVLG